MRVLAVDDFVAFRQTVQQILEQRQGFQIVGEASEGFEAVEKARELKPDLILLDVGLPRLNGIEAAKQIGRLARESKILFVSLHSSADVVREALSLGALGYVHKPRAKIDLLPAVEAVLGGKRFLSSGLEFSEGEDAKPSHRHEILFCSDEQALLDGFTHFIATALNAGNAAIVLASESHRDSLLRRLRARGVDVNDAIQRGTYLSLDADEPPPDRVRFFEAVRGLGEAAYKSGKEHPRVAFCGERAGRLWAEGRRDEAVRLEQLCDELSKSHDVDILCAYPSPHGREDDHVFKTICAEHSAVHGLGHQDLTDSL